MTACEDFDPDQDCERLHNAMDGLGTNERPIIRILTRRFDDDLLITVLRTVAEFDCSNYFLSLFLCKKQNSQNHPFISLILSFISKVFLNCVVHSIFIQQTLITATSACALIV